MELRLWEPISSVPEITRLLRTVDARLSGISATVSIRWNWYVHDRFSIWNFKGGEAKGDSYFHFISRGRFPHAANYLTARAIPRRESRKSRSSVSAVRKRSRRFHAATAVAATIIGDLDLSLYIHANFYPMSAAHLTSRRPLVTRDRLRNISLSLFLSGEEKSAEGSHALWKASNLPMEKTAVSVSPLSRVTAARAAALSRYYIFSRARSSRSVCETNRRGGIT